MKQLLDLFRSSPFFEVFPQEYLAQIADHSVMRAFEKGEAVFHQGERANVFYMLAVGQIRLSFESESPEAAEPGEEVLINAITEPGRPFGWSALVEPIRYRATATATENTQAVAVPRDFLERLCHEHLDFGVAFRERLLWVLGNRLRAARIRLVAKRYEQEVVAIRALLSQSAEELGVASPLHKIPYYLENRLTLADAFHCLDLLRVHGDQTERHLAELCTDVLESVRREVVLYRKLQTIYETIANAPADANVSQLRNRCCKEFVRLFENTDYEIRGAEKLPEKPGHVIVMNHLRNHPDNILPNEFQLTMDTHFVSSMILFKKYGEAPIRVIRKSRRDEYGHQKYYDRLGYIYVYRGFVDELDEDTGVSIEDRREMFFDSAKKHLLAGHNVVICPEGTSTSTEESPLPFRTGAFRLAACTRPEPLIVPIAVAHFDKKITRAKVVAVVHEPFLLSDHVSNAADNKALTTFMDAFQGKFRTYVSEAIQLGG